MENHIDNPHSAQGRVHDWKESAHSHFERWADHYDRDLINIVLFDPTHRRVLTQLRQWRRWGATGLRMLDIGCGTGSLLLKAARIEGLLELGQGLDMSANMVSYAQEKASRAGQEGRVRFLVGDAEHLPFEAGTFDVVTCCNSFHHYPHQDRAVAQMRRVLRPGGYVVIVDGYRDDPWGWFIFDVCVARAEKHVHHCSAARFRRLFGQAGLREMHQHVFGVCPPVLFNRGRK